MHESVLTRRLKTRLRGFWHRNHGSPAVSGLPDLEGVIARVSHVIEVKKGHVGKDDMIKLEHKLTDRQKFYLGQYKENGAVALLGIYLTDLKEFVFLDFESSLNFKDIEKRQEQWAHRLYI